MAIRTAEEYLESLRDGRTVYYNGERVEDVTEHPVLKVCAQACSMDYRMAADPRYHDLFVERTEEGEPVPFVYVAARSAEDLLRRRRIIQLLARACFGLPGGAKFTGVDGLNAVSVVCRRMDRALGTGYTERVEKYRRFLQQTDPAIALAMTDVKGDRSLRPARQQEHKEYYLRVVKQTEDGIVVRGAKTHISLSPCANEMVVLPCRNMREDEREYAVAFALPINTKGLILVSSGREPVEEGDLMEHPLNAALYTADATVIFDDVFVPWERVFMNGEWQFSGDMVYTFADFHRVSADAYKVAELEILVGAALLMAEYNGLERVPHIQDKLSWLIMYAEATEALGRAACEHCVTDPDSGLVYPNPLYSNISKFFYADNYHQAVKFLQDIAGGSVITLPQYKDFLHPEVGPLLHKYFGGKAGIPAEHRIRAFKLIRDISAATHAVTTIHAEGSLAAQRLSIYAVADLEKFKAAAKRVIGLEAEHPLFKGLPPFPPGRR